MFGGRGASDGRGLRSLRGFRRAVAIGVASIVLLVSVSVV